MVILDYNKGQKKEEIKMSYDSTKDTVDHINIVRTYLHKVIENILTRSVNHDKSKLEEPELATFNKCTPLLSELTYGSPEYKEILEEMAPILAHHYANSRHHPEHYKNGINDMNIIDLIEMICDWKAATLRHNDGNIRHSLDINAKRFGMDAQMTQIFTNTIEYLEMD